MLRKPGLGEKLCSLSQSVIPVSLSVRLFFSLSLWVVELGLGLAVFNHPWQLQLVFWAHLLRPIAGAGRKLRKRKLSHKIL